MGVTDDLAPSFTQKPQLRQEDEGNKLIFECQLLGSPKPEICWYRSDEQLKEDSRTKFKIQSIAGNKYLVVLELDDVIETDAGLYKVKAKNKMGEVAASINLNFSPADEDKQKQVDGKAPTFAKKPAIRQEDDGKRLIFECRIEADPLPSVTWFQTGVEVKPGPRHKVSVNKEGKSYFASLEISNVTVEDAGKYKVTAKNELGESNATISLNFDSGDDENGFAPSFVEKPRIIPNEDGTLITMRCVCKAKPAAEVTWYQGTTVIKASKKIEIKSSEMGEDKYELILLLSNPTAADGGAYRCHVKNEYGESNANLNLNIEAEPEPEGEGPTFVEKPTIQSKDNGKLVTMGCKVKASPKPTIVWYHEGIEIKESSKIKTRVEVKEDVYTIILELIDPAIEDSGLYKCNIKNELGELNANLTLNIEIIPVIKEKPKIIKIVKKKTVIVECKVLSKFAPACTWFKETNAVKEDARHTVLIEPSREGEFTVKLEISNVSQTDKGSYKLVAKNEKGEATSQVVEISDIPEEKGDKPQIIKHFRSLAKKENEEAEFVAVLKTSDQSCRCTWYKNSSVIRESSDLSTSFDGTNARIIIRKVSSKYVANYRVVIKNEFGEDESSADLTIVEDKKKKEEKEEEEEEDEKTVMEESEEEMSIMEDKSITENHVEEKKKVEEKISQKKEEEKKIQKKEESKEEEKKKSLEVTKKVSKKVEEKKELKVDAKIETKKEEEKKIEQEKEEAKKLFEKKTAKTEEEKKALLEKLEKKKQPQPEEAKIEGIPKLKPVKPKEEEIDAKKDAAQLKKTDKTEVKKKVVKKKVVDKKEDDEMEFVDDYERPVLEKYEKISPTPLAKKAKEDDTDKLKRGSISESVTSEQDMSEDEPSIATPSVDKKTKSEPKAKDEEPKEAKRLSIKKGVPKPEEPVDEISNVKLSKTPTKPAEEPAAEPQVAKTKKPVKKPGKEDEFVDDYERPDLEKYEKFTPTPSERAKKENGVKESEPEFVDDYEKPELEKYEKYTPTPKDKRPSDAKDEAEMMKGKIKPKGPEEEPEKPTLKKIPTKGKAEETKPEEKAKPKPKDKDKLETKKRPADKDNKVEEAEFVDDYERPVLEKYEKITPTPTEKKKKDEKKPEEEEATATALAKRRSVKDKDKPEPMDVDESVSLTKPKTPAKPGKEPEEVSLTHKTPAETKPTEGEAEAKLHVKKPEIIEDKTIKRPSPKDKPTKGEDVESDETVNLNKPRTKTSTTAPEEASLTQKTPAKKKPTEGTEAAELKVKKTNDH